MQEADGNELEGSALKVQTSAIQRFLRVTETSCIVFLLRITICIQIVDVRESWTLFRRKQRICCVKKE